MTLFYRHIMAAAALAAALILGGCGGGGGGGAPLADMSVVAGLGTVGSPYRMPEPIAAGTVGGIEDWYAAGPGWWVINFIGMTSQDGASNGKINRISYNTATDAFSVIFNDDTPVFYTHTLTQSASPIWGAAGWYDDASGTALRIYDADPAASQYGTFGILRMRETTGGIDIETAFFFHEGLRTDPANVPASGTATYDATYDALHITDTTSASTMKMATAGQTTLMADFTTGAFGTVASATNTPATFADGSTFSLSLNGSTSSNYSLGTATGKYWDGVTGSILYDFTGGAFTGGFYGPAIDEVAGSFDAGANASLTTVSIVGGFWGTKQ